MKNRIKLLSILLALVLGLLGCHAEETNPTQDVTPSDSTISAETAHLWYESAARKLQNTNTLVLTYSYTQERTVGTDTFTTAITGTNSYFDLQTDAPEAVISQSISYGTYGVQYTEMFSQDSAYIIANGCNFIVDCNWNTFAQRLIPGMVLDVSLYDSIEPSHTTDGTLLTFSRANALEQWECADENAVLLNATGTALLDTEHLLSCYTYTVSYTLGAATYTTSLTLEVTTPHALDYEDVCPAYPQSCVSLSSLDVPKLLLRSVGDIFTAQSFNTEVTLQATSTALNLIRVESNSFSISGSGDNMVASADYLVTLSDYRGITTSTSQSEHYAEGIFTRISNGGSPVQTLDTPENIRIKWENNVLNGLFALTYLDGAQLTETEEFYILDFQGNEAYRNAISSSLNTIFSSDLDSLSTSYTDNLSTGYLTINKQTGLPTAMGMDFSRTHVLYGVSYPVTYQLDQTLCLSEAAEPKDTDDETATDPLTPLFYQVTGPDGQKMWLLGTIHIGDARTDDLPNEIIRALKASDALAVEYDVNEFLLQVSEDTALQNTIAQLYYYADGSTIADHISDESYQKLSYLLTVSGCANNNSAYMRPVFLANVIEEFYLEQGYQFTSELGVDMQLLNLASHLGKDIISIESGLSQIQLMASLSNGLQQLLLTETLESSIADYNNTVARLYESWCSGDEDALYELLFGDDTLIPEEDLPYRQEYTQKMITARNAAMLSSAIDCLESEETVFFAVGLTHLLGEDGLLAGLEDAGYTIHQVSYS